MTSNKINASTFAFRFRYRQSFPAAARSGYLVRFLSVQLAMYVTVYLTLYTVNGLLSDPRRNGTVAATEHRNA